MLSKYLLSSSKLAKFACLKISYITIATELDKFRERKVSRIGILTAWLKYFNKIYGVSDGIKPNVDAYTNACSDYKYSECLIIGDNYYNDICVPMKLGMNTIYFNRLSDNNDNEINNLNELINRL